MMSDISLRDVVEGDISIFFVQQQDPLARHTVAFSPSDPTDRVAFWAKWDKILGDDSSQKKTIVLDSQVVGNVLCFLAPWSGKLEVGYWIGREFWGKGIATRALALFLNDVTTRPLYAGVAKDNAASIRVLEKCGFTMIGQGRAFAAARGEEIDELMFELVR